MNIDQTRLLERWQKPNPNFASGFDKRTSDSALLESLYGGYLHAKNQQWLNGGRALIDKTYLKMLWDCYADNSFPPDFTQLAQRLDNLLRSEALEAFELGAEYDNDQLTKIIEDVAEKLGLSDEISNVILLLFFLAPNLPIIPIDHQNKAWQDNLNSQLHAYDTIKSSLNFDMTPFKHTDNSINNVVQESAWLERRGVWLLNQSNDITCQ